MKRFVPALSVLFLSLTASGYGQLIDPVGFCPTVTSDCFTGNGIGNETIGVGTTAFVMGKNGNADPSLDPWYLILALPDYAGSAPTLTSANFTLGSVTAGADYLPTSPDLYGFTGTVGDNSMNAANMFGANEVAAFGSVPSFFEVFVYTYSPSFSGGMTPYSFVVGGGLPPGTFLAASGGSNPFSTPFTTTGLVDGPGCTPDTCSASDNGGTIPEPSSIMLLGTALLVTISFLRRKVTKRS